MNSTELEKSILEGIPEILPVQKSRNVHVSHAPNRKNILNKEEKKLALKNALRYLPKDQQIAQT